LVIEKLFSSLHFPCILLKDIGAERILVPVLLLTLRSPKDTFRTAR
jgi:hypothetical protein